MSAGPGSSTQFDAIVIGAGLSGMYQIHKLRELGLAVRGYEAGSSVAGTWYWNRYPGARCDSPGYMYQYWFSEELLAEWNWSERFPAQPETERYLNFVADKFDLRRDIRFDTRVDSAHYDEARGRWEVTTATGERASAQFLVMASGGLSTPATPGFPGEGDFRGQCFHSAQWPREPVDFGGKRVGVFGTGATGIQIIQSIAGQVGHLTVFQRTPHYAIPMRNPKYDDADRAAIRAQYGYLRHRVHETFSGFDYNPIEQSYHDLTPAERERVLQELWDDGSLVFWTGSFREILFDPAVNAEISEFVRERIRARIADPAVAAKLVPTTYGYGTRRVPLENGYYDVFNQDNVTLVDLRETPIARITADGVRTSAGHHPLDTLIYATGFDAGTGTLTRIDLRGRGGQSLKDAWEPGIRTWMGLQVHGFPNLFMVMAPMSPAAAFCNVPTCSQQQVDWITDTIEFVRTRGSKAIEPSAEAEARWVAHHDELANQTLVPKTDSWYMGTNIAGKERRLLAYIGGVNTYKNACDAVKAGGYRECVLA